MHPKMEAYPEGMFFGTIAAVAAGGAGASSGSETTSRVSQAAGRWSGCPAFLVGNKYTLTVQSASNAQLEDAEGGRHGKLEYLGSAAVPLARPKSESPIQTTTSSTPATAQVHITSLPTGAEIYVDGKLYGDTPSDITLTTGPHVVRVTIGGKVWSRTLQITAGQISIHEEVTH